LAFADAFVFEADFCQGFCIGDVLIVEQDGWFLDVVCIKVSSFLACYG